MSGSVGSSRLYDLAGGLQVAVRTQTFRPAGAAADAWGRNGKVEPDGVVSAGWTTYTEENDPYMAKALEFLRNYP
jgi:hypothetical protein